MGVGYPWYFRVATLGPKRDRFDLGGSGFGKSFQNF
jgi:hypothetical protein